MTENEKKKAINSVMCWLLFGIIFVTAPSLFHYAYRSIVGFNDNLADYLPDLLLVVASVCCNLINIVVDSEKSVKHLLRWIISICFGLIGIACWLLYALCRFVDDFGVDNKFIIDFAPNALGVSVIIIIINAVIGCIIEIVTAKK